MKEVKQETNFKKGAKEAFKWFSDHHNIVFVAILLFAFAIRIYFFFKTMNQPLWWDEAVYLLKAKAWAFGTPDVGFNAGRQIGSSALYALLYKFGATEITFRFLQILFSLGSIILIYFLGSKIFNKKIALTASFLFSVFWVDLFVDTRLLPEPIGLFTALLLIYCFYEGFVLKKSKIAAWLVGPLFIIAFVAREINILFPAIFFVYLLFTDKLAMFKNKNLWISLGSGLIASLPYFLYYWIAYGNPLQQFVTRLEIMQQTHIAAGGGEMYGTALYFTTWPMDALKLGILILFIIGLWLLIKLFLSFNTFWKQESKQLNDYMFLFLCIIIPFVYFAFNTKLYDERYLMMSYPAIFLIAGHSLMSIYDFIKKKIHMIVAVLIVILFLLFIAFINIPGFAYGDSHIQRASSLIKDRLTSYEPIKEAGLWLKENSNKNDLIISQSQPQLVYYSERLVQPFGIAENQTEFESKVLELKPRYAMVSLFEQHPEWINNYIQQNQNKLKIANALLINPNDTSQGAVLVIYEFLY